MYIYYEHHKDQNNKIILTELRLSSYSTGYLAINFKANKGMEEIIFKSCVATLKFPPLTNYSYDTALKVWSFWGQYGVSGTYGEEVIKKIEAVVLALGGKFQAFAVEDLANQAVNNTVDLSAKSKKKMSAEEFFYNHGATVQQVELTKDQIIAKFRDLTGFTYFDKKSYRQAASIFHPDRAGQDKEMIARASAKMSEINMLWQALQRVEKAQEVVNA